MAKLEYLHRWHRLVPDIGGNKELPAPFFLEVASGLSVEATVALSADLQEAHKRVAETQGASRKDLAEALAGVLSRAVRMGSEPLEVAGKPVTTLAEYIEMTLAHVGAVGYLEITQSVRDLNSVDGVQALFFARHSGGTATTPAPSVVKDAGPTGGR